MKKKKKVLLKIMNKLIIIAIVIIIIIILISLGLFFLRKPSTSAPSGSSSKPSSSTPVPPPPPVCDKTACNAYIKDMILDKSYEFTIPNPTYCTNCPFMHYSWVSGKGYAIDRGSGFVSCGTPSQCYTKALLV